MSCNTGILRRLFDPEPPQAVCKKLVVAQLRVGKRDQRVVARSRRDTHSGRQRPFATRGDIVILTDDEAHGRDEPLRVASAQIRQPVAKCNQCVYPATRRAAGDA